MSTIINIGVIGYGVVGSGVVSLLRKQKQNYQKHYDVQLKLKSICDRRVDEKIPQGLSGVELTKDPYVILNDKSIDVVVELIGGKEPAKTLILTAMENGKHVVTANKDLIANFGPELFKAARKHGVRLYYESSVGAGIPMIRTITEGIAGNQYQSVYGIVNGTCNYILDVMDKQNMSFDEAVKSAQELGYAESDPTLDINGMDAAHKIAILVSLAFGKKVAVNKLYVEGIKNVSYEDIQYAKDYGMVLKLLAIAKQKNGELDVRVHPTFIPKEHSLAWVNGVKNAMYAQTKPFGPLLVVGEGAGQNAAASGVMSDLVNLATQGNELVWVGNNPIEDRELKLLAMDDVHSEYYIRFEVEDKSGVLSKITTILGQHDISISSIKQKYIESGKTVPLIIITHTAKESEMQKALKAIAKLSHVKGKPLAIRIENIK